MRETGGAKFQSFKSWRALKIKLRISILFCIFGEPSRVFTLGKYMVKYVITRIIKEWSEERLGDQITKVVQTGNDWVVQRH